MTEVEIQHSVQPCDWYVTGSQNSKSGRLKLSTTTQSPWQQLANNSKLKSPRDAYGHFKFSHSFRGGKKKKVF